MGLGREILKLPLVKPALAIVGIIGLYGIYLGDQEAKQAPKAPPVAEAPATSGPTTALNAQVESKVLGGFLNPAAFSREGFTWKDTGVLNQYKNEDRSVAFIGGSEEQARALARCAAALDLKRIDVAEGQTLTATYSAGDYPTVAAKCEAQYRGTNRAFIVG